MPAVMSIFDPAPVGSGGSHGAPDTLILFNWGLPCLPCQRHWLDPCPRYRPFDNQTSGGAEHTDPAEPGRVRYDKPLLGRTGADWLLDGRTDWLLPTRMDPPLEGRPAPNADDCRPPAAKSAVDADGVTRRICTRDLGARCNCWTSPQLFERVVAILGLLGADRECSPAAARCGEPLAAGCGRLAGCLGTLKLTAAGSPRLK